jgi:hypothetical protein
MRLLFSSLKTPCPCAVIVLDTQDDVLFLSQLRGTFSAEPWQATVVP